MVLMIVSLRAFADSKVSFTASAPDVVAVGDQFRLSYTVTTQKVRDFRAPSIKGFDGSQSFTTKECASYQWADNLYK